MLHRLVDRIAMPDGVFKGARTKMVLLGSATGQLVLELVNTPRRPSGGFADKAAFPFQMVGQV